MNPTAMTNPSNVQQVRNAISQQLLQQPPLPAGWQQTCNLNDRINSVHQLYSSLSLLQTIEPRRCLTTAHSFESAAFRQYPSKEEYLAAINAKLAQITEQRQNRANNNRQLGNMNPMGMMPPHNMQNPMSGQTPAQANQGFNSQLQRPMQATPLSQNHQNPYAQGMVPQGMSMNQASGAQIMQQQPVPNVTLTEPELQQITTLAQQKANSMTQDDKNKVWNMVPPHQREQLQRLGDNSIVAICRQQIMRQFMLRKSSQQLRNGNVAPSQNMMPGMATMQGPQPAFGRPSQQMQTNQPQANGFHESQDVNVTLLGQQAEAQKSQEAGQVVVPASNNPNVSQPMTSQQSMGAQNAMAQQQMFNNRQLTNQQGALRAQQQQQQQLREQQLKLAQANQTRNMALQGQVGGLNGSQPPQQSPAMPNLNRPMVPPGSNNLQSRQQQGGPAMQPSPVPMENRMSQQGHMNMPNQQGFGASQNAAAMQVNRNALIPPHISLELRQKLMAMPEPNFQAALNQIQQSYQRQMATNRNNNQMASQPQFSMQPGRVQMQQNPLQSGHQQLNVNSQPQNVGSGQQQQQPQQNGAIKQLSHLQQVFMNTPARIAEWDQKPAPPQIRNRIPRLPEHAQTWGQVKNHITNAALNPMMATQILHAQSQHFEHFATQMRAQNGISNGTGHAGNMQNQNAMSMAANGPAPPAQMVAPGQQQVPPQAKMGVQPQMPSAFTLNNLANMNQAQIVALTPQDLDKVRSRMGAKGAQMDDNTIRQMLWNQRNRMQQSPQNLAAPQMQGNMMNQQFHLGPNMMQQGRPQGQPPVPQPQQTQQIQTPKPQAKPGQTPAKPMQQAGIAQAQQIQRGQKRPASNDDVMEVPPPKVAKPNDAPHMQQSKSQQGVPKMTPDPMANLKPEEKAKVQEQIRQQAMAKASTNTARSLNQANGAPVSAGSQVASSSGSGIDAQRFQLGTRMMKEIHESITKSRPAKPLTEAQSKQVETLVKRSEMLVNNTIKQAHAYYVKTADENLMRQIAQPALLVKSVSPGLKNNRSLATPEELSAALNAMMQNSKLMFERMKMSSQQVNTAQPQAPVQAKPAEPLQPLNAANLQAHQKEIIMAKQAAAIHRRSNSKTPSAPTVAQPPFQLGAPSPHGAPIYANEYVPDKLKIPPGKRKTQTGSAASTPGQPTPASVSSPQLTKSPDLKRAHAPEPAKPAPPKPMFSCMDNDCVSGQVKFATREELGEHLSTMHPVIDDPMAFVIACVAEADGCNTDGTPKQPTPTPNSKKSLVKSVSSTKDKLADANTAPMARSASKNQSQVKASTPGSSISATKPAPKESSAAAKDGDEVDTKQAAQTAGAIPTEQEFEATLASQLTMFNRLHDQQVAQYEREEREKEEAQAALLAEEIQKQKAKEAGATKQPSTVAGDVPPTTTSPPEKTPELSPPSNEGDNSASTHQQPQYVEAEAPTTPNSLFDAQDTPSFPDTPISPWPQIALPTSPGFDIDYYNPRLPAFIDSSDTWVPEVHHEKPLEYEPAVKPTIGDYNFDMCTIDINPGIPLPKTTAFSPFCSAVDNMMVDPVKTSH